MRRLIGLTAGPCGRIRPARLDEAATLGELARRATEDDAYAAEDLARLAPMFRVNPARIAAGLVLVAENRLREPVGVAGFKPLGPAGLFLLERLFVDPAAKRHGVGRRLFAAVAAQAQQYGGCSLVIYASPASSAFYRRLGAIRIGTTPSVYLPDLPLPVYAYPLSGREGGEPDEPVGG